MILLRKIFFLIIIYSSFFFGNQGGVCSQNKKTDSLPALLKTDVADTNRANILNALAMEFRNSDPDTAIYFAQLALKLSEKNNFQKGIAESYMWLGTASTNLGKFEEALSYLSKALNISVKINDRAILSRVYNNIGLVYKSLGNYNEALKNYFASLKIREATGDKGGIATCYNNIGVIYRSQGNYSEALKFFFASLKIRESIADKAGIAASYSNIGLIYYSQGNFAEALKNYLIALKMQEEAGNKPGIAICYNNIGGVYRDLGNYEEALKCFSAGLKIQESLGDMESIASCYNNIGLAYFSEGNSAADSGDKTNAAEKYREALKNYLTALKILQAVGGDGGLAGFYINIGLVHIKLASGEKTMQGEKNKLIEAEGFLFKAIALAKAIGNKECLRDSYRCLEESNSLRGNFKGAFENDKLYILYRDSLDNEETRKKTIQSQMTFDFEKKEAVATAEHKKEMESQKIISEEKSRKQKLILRFTVFGLLIVLVFVGFIFRSLRITRKQKKLIEEQKEEVQKQKHVVEEKQKEILDSIYYARRIQRALITNEKYFSKNLNRLNK